MTQRRQVIADLRALAAVGENGAQPCHGMGTIALVVGELENRIDDPATFHFYATAAFSALGDNERAFEQSKIALATNPNHQFSDRVLNIYRECFEKRRAREWAQARQNGQMWSLVGMVYTDHPPTITAATTGYQVYDMYQIYNYMLDLDAYRRWPTRVDPLFVYVYGALLAFDGKVEFTELGGTMFAAYEKIRNCENLFRGGLDLSAVTMTNVEYSDFLADMSRHLHLGIPIRIYHQWGDVPAPEAPRVSFSMGVGSYAFASSEEYANWLSRSRFTVIREEFALGDRDQSSQVGGKRFTYFGVQAFVRSVEAVGHRVRQLIAYPVVEKADGAHRIKTVPLYLIIENLDDNEQAAFRSHFDSLDMSSCKDTQNGSQGGRSVPLSSAVMRTTFDPSPYRQQTTIELIEKVSKGSVDLEPILKQIKAHLQFLIENVDHSGAGAAIRGSAETEKR